MSESLSRTRFAILLPRFEGVVHVIDHVRRLHEQPAGAERFRGSPARPGSACRSRRGSRRVHRFRANSRTGVCDVEHYFAFRLYPERAAPDFAALTSARWLRDGAVILLAFSPTDEQSPAACRPFAAECPNRTAPADSAKTFPTCRSIWRAE